MREGKDYDKLDRWIVLHQSTCNLQKVIFTSFPDLVTASPIQRSYVKPVSCVDKIPTRESSKISAEDLDDDTCSGRTISGPSSFSLGMEKRKEKGCREGVDGGQGCGLHRSEWVGVRRPIHWAACDLTAA